MFDNLVQYEATFGLDGALSIPATLLEKPMAIGTPDAYWSRPTTACW